MIHAMWRWHRKLVERDDGIGLAAAIAVNIAVWMIALVLTVYVHRLLFRLGWVHSSSGLSWDDVACAILTGSVVGLYEWADYNKKREIEERKRQGVDATMI
jgi:hypothetical protein